MIKFIFSLFTLFFITIHSQHIEGCANYNETLSGCTYCKPGYGYNSQTKKCSICPSGQFSPGGTSSCDLCSNYNFCKDISDENERLKKCPYYSYMKGSRTCDLCPSDKFVDIEHTVCLRCLENCLECSNGEESGNCKRCENGYGLYKRKIKESSNNGTNQNVKRNYLYSFDNFNDTDKVDKYDKLKQEENTNTNENESYIYECIKCDESKQEYSDGSSECVSPVYNEKFLFSLEKNNDEIVGSFYSYIYCGTNCEECDGKICMKCVNGTTLNEGYIYDISQKKITNKLFKRKWRYCIFKS